MSENRQPDYDSEEISELENTDTSNESSEESPMVPDEILSKKAVHEIFDWLEVFVFSATVVLLLFSFVFRMTVVNGPSMENTLLENEFLIISELYFQPQQGDIIVCQDISNEKYSEPLVKRVIATEGQVVDIDFSTWVVTVDGEVLDEPYIKLDPRFRLTSDWIYPLTVPENHVFVMGDNRNVSADSRCADIGPIDERCIIGKAIFRVFPISKMSYLG